MGAYITYSANMGYRPMNGQFEEVKEVKEVKNLSPLPPLPPLPPIPPLFRKIPHDTPHKPS